MRFSRLRLSGFKSFVDSTEMHIERGLTGVVGPNGCGKSNLLEAIRWVMGENRAKSLRGSGMDDVIFAGTDRRPARNMAEVTLVIDNFDRTAPADYNDEDTIEVTRRIERDSGSAYRINGKDVRQKDVQLLFADAATGAHSPALVSQGRIGSLINAKPQDRRQILEEAAGISGLHTRRKEAESRLRSAEGNLVRVQDVVQAMESQIGSLKRQAKQAVRYRNVSGEIRQAEASLLFIKWKLAAEEVIELERKQREAEQAVAEITIEVSRLSQEHGEIELTLAPLREADASTAAKVQRLSIERENLEAETERRKQTALSLRAQLEQIANDREREAEIAKDAKSALDRLTSEKSRLSEAQQAEKASEIEAREILNTTAKAASIAEIDYDKLSETAAQARAQRSSLESDRITISRRNDQLASEEKRLNQEVVLLAKEDAVASALQAAQEAISAAEAELEKSTSKLQKAETATVKARADRNDADALKAEWQGQAKALSGEIKSLERLLRSNASDETPISDELKAQKGLEIAVGAAFGEEVDAGIDAQASRYWQELPPGEKPQWPNGVAPLADYVTVPRVLEKRLSHIGLVDEGVVGSDVTSGLQPGQILVDRIGNYWRWDGYVQKAGAPTQAAIRLEQKNRLEELHSKLKEIEIKAAKTEADAVRAFEKHQKARLIEQELRLLRQAAEKTVGDARHALVVAEQEASKRQSKVRVLEDTLDRIKRELGEVAERIKTIDVRIAELPDNKKLEHELAEKRANVEQVRSALSAARASHDSLRREAQTRQDRLNAIVTESGAWDLRVKSADKHVNSLNEREIAAQKQLEAAEASPEDLENRKLQLLEKLTGAENDRRATSDALAVAENKLSEKMLSLKKVEADLNQRRERSIRSEAAVENAADRRKAIAGQIGERFECAPTHLLEKVELEASDDLPDAMVLESKLEQLKRERDRLGAVNLRADEELDDIVEQMDHLVKERSELEEAISRLRHAIANLNKEGRERLLAAFDVVNGHFGELFKTLFGGGEAYLELTESDDPLNAGLEIYASPPGKKMQALSLLSGGEQALTALSLIFAVFITNPAPICVLDEVDAPLDDANVERFCNLLDNMITRTDTRFLIVTHNAVSMSRMKRLFGVTMAERGISTLVSVDLEGAEQLKEAS